VPRASKKGVSIRWVSKQQLKKALDTKARRVVGLSGSAFRKRFGTELGRKSLDRKAGIVELMMLCSFTGGKRASANRRRSR
jgi:hypothetical protein